ncbi:MAG: amidase, partial [Desulfobulbia bacterium]
MADDKPLWSYSALELHKKYHSGETDPISVATACFERIESVNPVLNSVIYLNREEAISSAEESRDRFRRNETKS